MSAIDHDGPSTRSMIAAGIGLTLLGIFLFTVNDAIGKWILASHGVGQMLLFRSIVSLIVLAPMIWRLGIRPFRDVQKPWLQLLRGVLAVLETIFFFWAVSFLPLADVTTFYLAAPILVTIMAALLLGEHVGWRRWTAIAVGFGGVVLALNPSAAALTLPALIALIGSAIFALLVIVTRHLRATPDIVLITFQVIGTLIYGVIFAPLDWRPMSMTDGILVTLLGVIAVGAHVCINRSLKLAPASTVAPYHYTAIVWAVIFGIFLFGDIPQLAIIAGAVLIIGSGLFIFFRERSLAPDEEPDFPER